MDGFCKLLGVFLMLIVVSGSVYALPANKIKFDGKSYNLSNPDTKTEKYIYLLKNENLGNWHSKVYREYLKDSKNPTESAAEFAYKIQEENPKAVVLVYPEAATMGYLTFDKEKSFYEYNTVVFKKSGDSIEKVGFARRFYASTNGGSAGAKQAAVLFAEKNNKKYMEMINKLVLK